MKRIIVIAAVLALGACATTTTTGPGATGGQIDTRETSDQFVNRIIAGNRGRAGI